MAIRRICAARLRCQRGSASVEFIGIVPAFLLVALIALQLILSGYTLWTASVAARAGARAAHVGAGVEAAARKAMPGPLRDGLEVEGGGFGGAPVTARVQVPKLLPPIPDFAVEASSELGPAGG